VSAQSGVDCVGGGGGGGHAVGIGCLMKWLQLLTSRAATGDNGL